MTARSWTSSTERQLLQAARQRSLSRANTLTGSLERSAVYRAEYEARLARANEEVFSPSQARGHPRRGETPLSKARSFTGVLTKEGLVEFDQLSGRQASTVGKYLASVAALRDGTELPEVFEARWYKRRVARVVLENDPDKVLALYGLPPEIAPKVRYVRRGSKP